jgi:anti-anti-sigma factor
MSANDLIRIEEQDGVHIARLTSQALLDPVEIDSVESEILALVRREEAPRVVIALEPVEHVSSLMISTLIKVRNEVEAQKGAVCLAALPARLRALFDVVKIGDVFEIFGTTEEAVQALKPGPE